LRNHHATSLRTLSNRSGGIQGGISNGEPIVIRVAFKPPATIGVEQSTADFDGAQATLRTKGRHDPCVLPRAIPIVEAMAALVLADCTMMQLAREAAANVYPVMGKIQPPQPKTAANTAAAAATAPAGAAAAPSAAQ
jgi:chorismate synthase